MKNDRKCKPRASRITIRFRLLLACAALLFADQGRAQQFELSENTDRAMKAGRGIPLRATFRLRLHGFVVHRQTWDDTVRTDGRGDEVYLVYNSDTVDITGRNDTKRTSAWGALSATHRALQTGDRFPAGPWPAEAHATSAPLFEAELIQGRTAGIFIPAIFESDGFDEIAIAYNRAVYASRTAIQTVIAKLINGPALTHARQILRRGETLGLDGLTASVLHGEGFTGERGDRPVGMVPPPPRRSTATYTFVPQGLVLTYDAANAIVRNDLFGAGPGVVVVTYRDDERLRGEYSLYFLVDRIPSSR